MMHFNNLTPAQAERLAVLAEECGEVVQVVGKILRHGYNSTHPNGGLNNRELLEKELGDIQFAVGLLIKNDLDVNNMNGFTKRKSESESESAHQYLHHQDGWLE